jgi:hypothetical protein
MEEQNSLFEINVDESATREIGELSRWSKLFGIIILCLMGLAVLFVLFAWDRLLDTMAEQSPEGANIFAGTMAVVGIIILAVVGIMMFFLIRSANRIRTSLQTKDQGLFNSGLNDLKTYFVFMGVFGIISLVSNLLSTF